MSSPFLDKYSGLPQVSTDAVPQSLKPSSYPKPIACDIVHTEYQASTAPQAMGGSINISVPMNPNMGLMAGQTTALKVQYDTAGFAADTYFKGVASDNGVVSGGVAPVALNSNESGTAYSLINRMQAFYSNAQAMNITNFRPFIDGLLAHGASSEFMARDASIIMGAGQDLDENGTRTAILPLPGLFASVRSLPLWAGSGNLQLNIDLNTLNNAVYCVAGYGAGTISNVKISLIYTAIIPPQEFVMAGKQQLQSGVYAFPYVDYQVIRLDSGASQNYMHPVGSSSLRSVHFTNHSTAKISEEKVNTFSARSLDVNGIFTDATGLSDIRLVCDSKQINNYPLSSATGAVASGVGVSASIFAELQKCFSRLYDSQRADNCTKLSFDAKRFMVGISTLRFGGDSGFDLVGTPCSSCTLSFTNSGLPATQFVVYTMDKILAIDGTGNASILH